GNRATLTGADAQANVAAADQWIESLHRHQVTRNLLHGKLIEGLVVVERANHIIAIRPSVAAIVVMQTVSVPITSVVKPVACALFAESRLSKQSVDKMLIRVGGRVVYESLNFFWCRQDSCEIKRYTTNERRLVGFRRRLQTFLFQFRKSETVNCVLRPSVAAL